MMMMMMMMITNRHAMIGGPKPPIMWSLMQVLMFYNCLLTFYFHEFDALVMMHC
jgi:hypothetical protein